MLGILTALTIVFFALWRFENLKFLTVLWVYEEKNAPNMSEEDIKRCAKKVIQHRAKDISNFLRRK